MVVLLWVLAGIFLLLLVGSLAVFLVLFGRGREYRPKAGRSGQWAVWEEERARGEAAFFALPHERLWMRVGRVKLSGVYCGAGTDKTVVLVHGWHDCAATRMGDFPFWRAEGYNVFIPDLRAHGQSGGRFVGFGHTDRADILAWIELLQARFGAGRVVLSGVSMGGAEVCMLSGDEELPSCVRAIVSDCAFSSLREQFFGVARGLPAVLRAPLVFCCAGWRRLLAGCGFSGETPVEQVKKSRTPTLFVHGTEDDFVPPRMCDALFAACAAPKEQLKIQRAGHALAASVGKERYAACVRAFLARYV